MAKLTAQQMRRAICAQLPLLPERWQGKFKLMYGRLGGQRSVEEALALSIDTIVTEVPRHRLSWALYQVENSFRDLPAHVQLAARGAREHAIEDSHV